MNATINEHGKEKISEFIKRRAVDECGSDAWIKVWFEAAEKEALRLSVEDPESIELGLIFVKVMPEQSRSGEGHLMPIGGDCFDWS